MQQWTRRVRGALGMGLIWAAGGFGLGGLLELVDNVFPGALPFIARVDMWPQTLAIPGFIGGVVFATMLGLAARRRRFEELSFPGFAAWGAATGLVLGGIAMSIGAPLVFVGVTTLVSAAAATGSLFVARMAARRERIGLGADHDALGGGSGEAQKKLGRRE